MVDRTNETAYLALDPGETSGWANFFSNGTIYQFGQFKKDQVHSELDKLIHSGLTTVITEDFVRYKHKRERHGLRNFTSEIIGAIETIAKLRGVSCTRQPASVYRVGAAWGGFDIPSNHSISHQWVAAAHGIYYLQQNGIRQPGQAILDKDI